MTNELSGTADQRIEHRERARSSLEMLMKHQVVKHNADLKDAIRAVARYGEFLADVVNRAEHLLDSAKDELVEQARISLALLQGESDLRIIMKLIGNGKIDREATEAIARQCANPRKDR